VLGAVGTGGARSIPHIDNHGHFEEIISNIKGKAISSQALKVPGG
jgi:hypothetical protein